MNEIGIDLSGQRPQRLNDELAARADLVVTMGCGGTCPFIPGTRYLDWDLDDPKGRGVDAVRATRDEIDRRVTALVADLDAAASAPLTSTSTWGVFLVYGTHQY